VTKFRIHQGITTLLLLVGGWFAQAANINQTAKLLPNAGEGASFDRMGQAVAVSGNTAVGAAYLANGSTFVDSGTVHVFTRTNATTWSRQQKINPPSAANNDLFGNAVAISGNTLAIAALRDDETSATDSGAVYIFTRSVSEWTLQQRINASDPTNNAGFGRSVALDGDTLIVGANRANSGTGAAYVFTRSGATWAQQQRLVAQDAALDDFFGGSVAISGDRLVVGAERADVGVSPDTKRDVGAAYVFRRTGVGAWLQQTKLLPSTYVNDDNFGISVAISGASIVVGQPFLGEGVGSNKGAAIVFTEDAGTWTRQATLVPADASADDYFGRSVAISGDLIVAGSYFDDFNTVVNGGSAYLYRRSGSVWSQSDKLLGSDTVLNDSLGSAVAISAGVTIVGAPFDANAFGSESGAAYAFTREDGSNTALALNTTSITFGQGATLTANISDSGFAAAAPIGSVTFYNGSTALQTVAVDGNGQAQYTFPNPVAGDLTLTARYSGDTNHLGSASSIRTLSVAKAATTLSITPPVPTTVPYGTLLTYSSNLSVSGVAPIPSGSIRFLDGSTLIGTATLSAGVATFNTNTLSVGTHSIKAEYLGDANYLGFTTAPASITVTKAAVTMNLVTTPSPSLDGGVVNLVATLTGGIPTGLTVGFQMTSPTSNILGSTLTNSGGAATFNLGALTVGSYQFSATYFGDSNHFGASDSSNIHNVLALANLTITKTNNQTFVQSGAATTYTIVVTNNGPNPVVGATVIDNIDDELITGLFLPNAPWTCSAAGGAACAGGASGTGDINLGVNLPVSGSVTIEVQAQSLPNAEPFLCNNASVVLPATLGDPDTSNNSSTDVDSSGVFTDNFENAKPPITMVGPCR
jgi:uncharacterized repeat protein (TIGR01451 family)